MLITPVDSFNVAGSQLYGENIVEEFVIQEIVLDHISLVAKAQDKIFVAIVGKSLHDVPENGFATYLQHGFGTELGFFPQPGTEATAKNYDLRF